MFARYLYKHSRYVTLVVICIIAVGITSFNSIARQEDPTLQNFVGTITTFYPSATPDRVEALVTRPLEDELRQISEIEWLRTASSGGVSFVNMRLKDKLTNEGRERAWTEVRDAISDASPQFPTGVAVSPWRRFAPKSTRLL